MNNAFMQIQDDKIIFDKNQLIMYAVIAAAVLILVVIITIAAKARRKNFIKTVPTNLKDEV
jgi:hypothetical protein